MLLFKEKHKAPMLANPPEKTETRRLWKKCRAKVGSLHWASTHLYKKEARFARLRITKVWQEPLRVISPESLDREGKYRTAEEYFTALQTINKRKIDKRKRIWVVRWERVWP